MLNLKTLLLILFSVLLFTGCKKDTKDTESYSFTASVNGIDESFAFPYVKLDSGANSVYLYQLGGIDQRTTDFLTFIFFSNNRTLLTPGTYTGTNHYYLTVVFKKNFTREYTNPGYSNFTIVITAINKVYIEGTFDGVVKDPQSPTDSIKITNGKFKVPFKE